MDLEFPCQILESLKHQISWKSVHWEQSCSMQTDGQADRQADMTKLTFAFRTFAKQQYSYTLYKGSDITVNNPTFHVM
jgi:hypothetical protein